MRIGSGVFKGEVPLLDARLLPEGYAQIARNVKPYRGHLAPFRQNAIVQSLPKAALAGESEDPTLNTIYAMDIDGRAGGPYWWHFIDSELAPGAKHVDIARGPVLGDTTELTLFSGTEGGPKVTNLALATDGPPPSGVHGGEYPYRWYALGVPAPTVEPELEVIPPEVEEGSITLTNAGAEAGATLGWTITGTLDRHPNGEVPGVDAPEGTHFWFGGDVATTEAYQPVDLVANSIIPGQVMKLRYAQGSGANDGVGQAKLQFYTSGPALISEVVGPEDSPGYPFVERELTATVPDGAVTARIVMTMENGGVPTVDENDAWFDDFRLSVAAFSYASDGSDLDAWSKSPTVGGSSPGARAVDTTADPTSEGHGSVFRFYADEAVAYIHKDFALSQSSFEIAFDLFLVHERNRHYVTLGATETGYGDGISILANRVEKRLFSTFDDEGVVSSEFTTASLVNRWVKVTLSGVRTGAVGANVTISIVDIDTGVELLPEPETIEIQTLGDLLVLKKWANEGGATAESYVDNITVALVRVEGSEDETIATNYVETFVTALGHESPPSPVSDTIQKLVGATVNVTLNSVPPSGHGIDRRRIYRAVTGEGTTSYLRVIELPVGTTEYEDTKTDAELGDPLESEDYDTPPEDLRGLLTLPNGVTAGFSGNQVCVSPPGKPWAFPVPWRFATDFPIVDLKAIDTDLIVTTLERPYIITAADPARLQDSGAKLEGQGNVSKRSACIVTGGEVFASPDGIAYVTRGALQLLTRTLFTRDQWQALIPESIHGVFHDGRYLFFYDDGDTQAAYLLDLAQGGFGVIPLDFYATAAYSHPLTDTLYLAIGTDLVQFEGGESLRSFVWRSGEIRLPRPTAFSCCQVRAASYASLRLRLYLDGADEPAYDEPVTSLAEFVLPDVVEAEDCIEWELTGTSQVHVGGFQMADDMDELE